MKGDFTRGHRPDQKRGEKYRRVLLQEGRLVLDSDVAASIDAIDTQVRDLASDVGCRTGSPDLGYLATPGPLFALFETVDGVVQFPEPLDPFKAHRDYGAKYHERFPSIHIDGTAGAGSVPIRGRTTLSSGAFAVLRIWARCAAGVTVDVSIEGVATAGFTGTDAATFKPYDVPVPAGVPSYRNIAIGFDVPGPGKEVWVGMIEAAQSATTQPFFWFTKGRYYLHGLAVESADDGQFPGATFPASVGFTSESLMGAPDVYVLAYLEGWERLITRIEDPGILEQALGGVLDTTVRSKAVGQVKLAFFAYDGSTPAVQSDVVPAAFANVDNGEAQLTVTTTPAVDNPDPCAIPEAGGYFGADNRLYRFEVHTGGGLGSVVIKWSKNNGADLFAVTSVDPLKKYIVLASGAEVRDGDLIELCDEPDDLGDQENAEVSLVVPSFRPAKRAVGQLFYAETTQTAGQIKLRLTNAAKSPTDVPADFGAAISKPKVRVWHGRLDTAPVEGSPVTEFELGDGVKVKLEGDDFRPGDYWQYEARTLKDNANGEWRKSPHGPERLFAPLALFKYVGDAQPLELIRWYDHQYSALCELEADDIAYDGSKVGTDADTVQEALDELYQKGGGGGCCDVVLEPDPAGGDDTARLQEAINALPDGQEICLERGIYHLGGPLFINGKRVTIAGCPHATVIGAIASADPMFEIVNGGQLTLRDLLVFARGETGPVVWFPELSGGGILIDGPGDGEPEDPWPMKLTLERTAAVHVGPSGIVVKVVDQVVPALAPQAAAELAEWSGYPGTVTVDAKESILLAPSCVVAKAVRCILNDSMVMFEKVGVFAATLTELWAFKSSFQGRLVTAIRDDLAALPDEDVESGVTAFLEGNPGLIAVAMNSIGIASPQSGGGPIEACHFRAWTAMFYGYASYVEARNNEYQCWATAVRIDAPYACSFDHDTFSGSLALHLPWQASGIDVSHCTIDAARGIVIGADANVELLPEALELSRYFQDVRLVHNEVLFSYLGIHIGPYFQAAEPEPEYIETRNIEIASNRLTTTAYSTIAVGCSLFQPWLPEDAPGAPRLRITGNQIDASLGIVTISHDVIVQNNVVHSTYPFTTMTHLYGVEVGGVQRMGMFFVDGGRIVVQDNVIEIDIGPPPEPGPGEDAPASVGIVFYEKYTEGEMDDILVQGNFVNAGAALVIPEGEQGAGLQRLVVSENRFAGYSSSIKHVYDGTIRDNTFLGPLEMRDGGRNVVSSNRFMGFSATGAGLEIDRANETWQIENNRSEGSIVARPGTFLNMAGAWEEYIWHPQVIGNWVDADLVVGHPSSPVTTGSGAYSPAQSSSLSGVQIVANRANDWLVAGSYTHIVVAHNFAKQYHPAWGAPTVITNPNYDAP